MESKKFKDDHVGDIGYYMKNGKAADGLMNLAQFLALYDQNVRSLLAVYKNFPIDIKEMFGDVGTGSKIKKS